MKIEYLNNDNLSDLCTAPTYNEDLNLSPMLVRVCVNERQEEYEYILLRPFSERTYSDGFSFILFPNSPNIYDVSLCVSRSTKTN